MPGLTKTVPRYRARVCNGAGGGIQPEMPALATGLHVGKVFFLFAGA